MEFKAAGSRGLVQQMGELQLDNWQQSGAVPELMVREKNNTGQSNW